MTSVAVFLTLLFVVTPGTTSFTVVGPQQTRNTFAAVSRSQPFLSTKLLASHDHAEEPTPESVSFPRFGHQARSLASNVVAATMIGSTLLFSVLFPSAALADSRVVGELKGSGLVFKDTLVVESFDDPKVKGVTLYISNFQRPITERLSKDFFSDPSYASVACAKTGSVKIADNIATGKDGEEVFEESRSILFKTLRVQRIYDKEKNTVVYVSFNTRLDKSDDTNKSRFKSSICALSLD